MLDNLHQIYYVPDFESATKGILITTSYVDIISFENCKRINKPFGYQIVVISNSQR